MECVIRSEPVEDFYEIGEDVGRGKFSEVREVVERGSKKLFAGKFIKKRRNAVSRRGLRREDIVREINILQQLKHPNIISLHEVFESNTEMVLILELVSGGELFDYLAEKDCVTEEVAAPFTKQILDGLQHMHQQSICHLDLKGAHTNFGVDPDAPLPMDGDNMVDVPGMENFLSEDEVQQLVSAISTEDQGHDNLWEYDSYMQCCHHVESLIDSRQ